MRLGVRTEVQGNYKENCVIGYGVVQNGRN